MTRLRPASATTRPHRLRRTALPWTLLAAGLAVSTPGCVLSPYDEGFIAETGGPRVEGFGTQPSAAITVEVLNQHTGAWEVLATTTTSATASVPAGLWNNSPALYAYDAGLVGMNDHSQPNWECWWDPGCQVPAGSKHGTLRVRQGEDLLLPAGEYGALECFYDRMAHWEDFYAAGLECGFDDWAIGVRSLS